MFGSSLGFLLLVGCTTPPEPRPLGPAPLPVASVAAAPVLPRVLRGTGPTACALSSDGRSLRLVFDGDVETWSVDEERRIAAAPPTAAAAPSVKHWRPTDDGKGVRLDGLDDAARQRLSAFAVSHGLRVEVKGGPETVLSPGSNASELHVFPSDDARVVVVAGQGYVAGIDLARGKTWRVNAWTAGAEVTAVWGARNDRVVLASAARAGNEIRVSHRLFDALSGKLVRDFAGVAPRWSATGARLVGGGLFDAETGARIPGPWDEAYDASFSDDDGRLAILGERGCEVFERATQHRLVVAPPFLRTVPLRPGGVCFGHTVVTVIGRELVRWDLTKPFAERIGLGVFGEGRRFVVEPGGGAATITARRALRRIDLGTFATQDAVWSTTDDGTRPAPLSAATRAGDRFAVVLDEKLEVRSFTDDRVVRGQRALRGTEAIAFSFDGKHLIAVGNDDKGARVTVVDATSGATTELLAGRFAAKKVNALDYPRLLALHPSAPRAAIAFEENGAPGSKAEVVVVDYLTGKEAFAFAGRIHSPVEIAFTPDGSLFLPTDSEPSSWSEGGGVRRLPDLRGLRIDVADVARFGVDPILAAWKDRSLVSPDGSLGGVMYCAAAGPRLWIDGTSAALVAERSDGSRLRFFPVGVDRRDAFLVVDPQGDFDAPEWVLPFLRAPLPDGTGDVVLRARKPGLFGGVTPSRAL